MTPKQQERHLRSFNAMMRRTLKDDLHPMDPNDLCGACQCPHGAVWNLCPVCVRTYGVLARG